MLEGYCYVIVCYMVLYLLFATFQIEIAAEVVILIYSLTAFTTLIINLTV